MKQYIIVLCFLFSYSYAQAGSCFSDVEEAKKLSVEKKSNFKIELQNSEDATTFVTISAPKKIDGKKLFRVSAYGENKHGEITYFFPVDTILKENRFTSGYEIGNDWIGSSYIQFSYGKCGPSFTYPLTTKNQ